MRIRVFILSFVCVALLFGAAPGQSAQTATHDARLVLIKHDRLLHMYKDGKIIKSYKVALGGTPIGAKTRQGDHKTPEGNYVLDSRNAHSHFYKSIHISYPSARDRTAARANHASPGGDVFIHGLPNGYGWIGSEHRLKDWTDGCVAITNQEMDELWQSVPNGTPIEIRP
jgi:murein L,D-transpeptidase YafK